MDEDDSALRAAAEQQRRREGRYESFIAVLYACIILSALYGATNIIERLEVGLEGGYGVITVVWIGTFYVLDSRGRLKERAWKRERERDQERD